MANMDWMFWPFTTKKSEYDPYGQMTTEQKNMTKQVGPYLQSQIGQSAPMYSGQYAAPMTANEDEMVARNARLGALGEEGFSNLLKGEFPEDYYQQAIYKPMMKQYQEDVQPLIEEQYAGSGGYWGGARSGAVAKGYRDLTDTLAAKRAELGYQAKRDVMDAATSYGGFEQANAAIQGIPRAITQYGLDKQYDEWKRTRPETLPYINQALAFLGLDTKATYKPEYTALQQMSDLLGLGADAAKLAVAAGGA